MSVKVTILIYPPKKSTQLFGDVHVHSTRRKIDIHKLMMGNKVAKIAVRDR